MAQPGDDHGILASLRGLISQADDRIAEVRVRELGVAASASLQRHEPRATAALGAALSAAARAAASAMRSSQPDTSVEARKKIIDGAATAAAESILSRGAFLIRVAAGEGERDDSPGAHVGQQIGSGTAADPQVDGVFDYVDGTALAADSEPGAVALGAIGTGVRQVPDLQAFAIIGPRTVVADLEISAPLEAAGMQAFRALAGAASSQQVTVLTHALGSRPNHRLLVEQLHEAGARVIVPPKVTVEPPYLLSLAGLSEPKIDCMIGGIGLSELSYAAALLDLIAPDFGIRFAVGSVSGPRRAPDRTDLSATLDFSDAELRLMAAHSLTSNATYDGADLISSGGALAAYLFTVTPNSVLGLPGAMEERPYTTSGIVVLPGPQVALVEVDYRS
jgi:fructose-1,6-bisphosphatase/sedoheptulose 1,7-bisphosphatase-like protein